MRIGIDARFFGSIGKGLGRYTQKLIENLEKIDEKNQYVIFLRKENWDDYQPGVINFKKVLAPFLWYTLKEQTMMPRVISKEKIDLMHFPHFNVPVFYHGLFIVTIHDLILLRFPTKKATTLGSIKYKIKELGYKAVINWAIKKAKKVIAVSEFTKNDIVEYFKVASEKVITVYEGVDLARSNKRENDNAVDSGILKKYNITKPYLLYVGNVYPHKNIEALLAAIKKISLMSETVFGGLKLVIVCKQDYFLDRIKKQAIELGIGDRVVFAGYAPDNDLGVIYQNGELYVFPSFYEGFGLPPLEAMGEGTPVISSGATSMPEILKNAALYFDPQNVNEIVELISKILGDVNLKQQLITRGCELVKEYSWGKMARETMEIYEKCKI